MYGQRIDYLSPTLYVTDVLVIFLFITAIIRKELTGNKKFLLVILFLSFSIFLSKSPFVGWYYLLKFLEMSFVGWYTFREFQIPNFKFQILSILFSLTTIFESLLATVQFSLHRSVGGLFYFFGERTFSADTPGIANASIHGTLVLRPYGTFSHPNVLAGFLLIGMLLLWYFSSSEVRHSREVPVSSQFFLIASGFTRTIIGLTLVIGSIGLLLTLSRTTILLGGGILLIILFKRFYKKTLFIVPLIVLCLILFPTLFYRFAPSTFEESASQRLQLLSAAWHMLLQSPLFGVGLGNFIPALPSATLLQPVHNIFVLWTTETGLLGAILMVWFSFALGKRMFDHWKSSSKQTEDSLFPLVLLGVSIVILGMFDHYFLTLQQGQLLLVFCLGLLWNTVSNMS